MKTIYKIIVALICITNVLAIQAQETNEEKRKQAEKNTSPFTLGHFSINEHSFYVLTVHVTDGTIVLDERAVLKEVGGKLPHQRGNFNIELLNTEGKVISNYMIPDPLLVRSCEEGKDDNTFLKSGTIQIPFQKSPDISRLVLIRDKQTVGNLDVTALIKGKGNDDKDEREDD
ncbi:hypothetical protein Q4Q34_16930 [Flavivirga abyssicola]|uniref:hypothetical protein n=1 Tax=Flavivirga abyssicola TaxID=3063533 RepID=UPI0026E046F5|nr:hypothetical protein [Flavivirga sp. MEBiC07777]WVK12901.1 hypothetical protein Q4Q34_16930 [Flavivirga sp. MEBiC07777]